MKTHHDVAASLLGVSYDSLDEHAKNVTRHIAGRTSIAKRVSTDTEPTTLGQRAADAVARFGGSWPFITIFLLLMIVWVCLNSYFLVRKHEVFDPYPYILLNLFLSMLAAIQAPIILMSQNRQAQRDRLDASHDYEVNLKAELEIMLLHEKMDLLRLGQWSDLLVQQEEQLRLLADLVAKGQAAAR
jgi:uncharacterized membrane protein